ncbi:helix-turn-helix transcriptional regulator [Flagellimonas allohymeniacidonis]|nr:AraC family transcriptional regulator [Allomuricauda hymeniacidonis]
MIQEYKQIEFQGRKVFEKAVVCPPFRHFYSMPNEACFFYMERGSSKLVTPTESMQIDRQEGVVMQCGNYLSDMISGEGIDYCEAVAVHLYPDMLQLIFDKEPLDFFLNLKKAKPVRIQRYKASELLRNYIQSIQFYFENPELVSEELMKLKLKELLLLLARSDSADAILQLFQGLFCEVNYEFKEVIESNIYNNLTLEELAKLTGTSLSSFKREFAKHYIDTPARYIRKKRLEKAAKLLKGTEKRISDIAYDCGFADLAHFSRIFHKKYNSSPSQYRLNVIAK